MRHLVSLSLALVLGASCAASPGATNDAGGVSDGGTTADAGGTTDAGPTDGGVVDPIIGYQTGFESPVVGDAVIDGQLPSGWARPGEDVQAASAAGLYRPAVGELDEAIPEGHQVLAMVDSYQPQATNVGLGRIFFIRPGETWEITMKVALSKESTGFDSMYIEADGDLDSYLGEAGFNATTLPTAGTFQTLTLAIPAQTEMTTVSLSLFARSMRNQSVRIFIDDFKIRRTSSPDALPIVPVHPYLLNASFEGPEHGMGGFDPSGAPGWTREVTGNGFTAEWRPTAGRVTQAEPLAAPATGNQLVDMGTAGSGTTTPMTSTLISSTFAMAEAGARYQALVAVGQRIDLDGCETARLAILADDVEIAHVDKAGLSTPKGGFVNMTLETTALEAASAGKALKVAISAMNGVTSTDCRLIFDNVRASKL